VAAEYGGLVGHREDGREADAEAAHGVARTGGLPLRGGPQGAQRLHARRVQRGTVVDFFQIFETELNKKLAADKKLKNKNLKVRVIFLPLRRDQLLPELAAGKGDIAAANLTITPERQKLVDFSGAGLSNVSEVVVTAPDFTEDCQPGRSFRQGRVRAQVIELL